MRPLTQKSNWPWSRKPSNESPTPPRWRQNSPGSGKPSQPYRLPNRQPNNAVCRKPNLPHKPTLTAAGALGGRKGAGEGEPLPSNKKHGSAGSTRSVSRTRGRDTQCTLVTNNVAHFQWIPNLVIENWKA